MFVKGSFRRHSRETDNLWRNSAAQVTTSLAIAKLCDKVRIMKRDDEMLLRRSFEVAAKARIGGDHPFGAVLADAQGQVLMEQGNGYSAEGHDRTAHAERLLASRAAKAYRVDFLADCTLYSSAEPCAMCAGAIYWAGIGRVVFGQTEKDLKRQTGAHEENPTLDLPCQIVFAAGQRPTEIVGPLLAEEAANLQEDFWKGRK
jgi:tRNA(Arg) A34 adenosine deaminase TadA